MTGGRQGAARGARSGATARVRAPGDRFGPVPRLPATYVPPRRLWRLLDDSADAAVTVVVAPAGAGKTLGVAGWLRRAGAADDLPVTWLSAVHLGQAELGRAVQAVGPASPAEGATQPGAAPGAAGVLVVDDAELLPPAALAALDPLLEQGGRGRLLLLTRWDLALSRVLPQLIGTLALVRGDSLRFDDEDARALVLGHAPDCPPDVLDRVLRQAGGWCAALVLAARAVRTAAPAALEAWPTVSGPAISDFVAHEVLTGLNPRQRHLLLSVAHEPAVTAAAAAHLAHDPGAGDLLEELESTGLLVGRARSRPGPDTYRVHPVLAEAARRSLAAGGADAASARAAVARAARIDLATGDLGAALARTLVGAGPDHAAALLSSHGLAMVLGHETAAVRLAASQCADALGSHRSALLALAVDRWLSGDEAGAAAGLVVTGKDVVADPLDVVIARLLHALLGPEPLADACAAAVTALKDTTQSSGAGRRSLLLTLVGEAQLWLDDVSAAEDTLAVAAAAARSDGDDRLLAEALAQLALAGHARGRTAAAADLALEARDRALLPTRTWAPEVVLALADLHDDPWASASGEVMPHRSNGRPVARFWWHLGQVLRLAVQGRCAAALDLLDSPVELPPLPRSLDVARSTVRTLVAAAADDVAVLDECAARLHALHAPAEADLAAGLADVCRADLPGGLARLRRASGATAVAQPDTVTIALVSATQVADSLGDREQSADLLEHALGRADRRRDALAMVGWLGHVTPVHALLGRSSAPSRSAWTAHVLAQARTNGSLAARVLHGSPTPAESRRARYDLVASLTPRERDVLDRLARGASYADIATDLVVSTNTVKTHVASLYAKLGAARRSEALATARALELL